MMIFNAIQCDFLLKNGARAIGAGVHHTTKNFYVYFIVDDTFNRLMTTWKNRNK